MGCVPLTIHLHQQLVQSALLFIMTIRTLTACETSHVHACTTCTLHAHTCTLHVHTCTLHVPYTHTCILHAHTCTYLHVLYMYTHTLHVCILNVPYMHTHMYMYTCTHMYSTCNLHVHKCISHVLHMYSTCTHNMYVRTCETFQWRRSHQCTEYRGHGYEPACRGREPWLTPPLQRSPQNQCHS